MILRMQNPLQDYAWGSRAFIQQLISNPLLAGTPVAEMWMGAHPKAPSQVWLDGKWTGLDTLLATDPALLGRSIAGVQAATLPFLFKVLAADEPLSIQAHPAKAQAREGFLRENALGLADADPSRNYRDANHKPELICALTEFTALCGFRPYQQIIANLQALGLDALLPAFPDFQVQAGEHSWRALFLQIMRSGKELASVAQSRLQALLQDSDPQMLATAKLCAELAEYYPSDPGILAPLYLNIIHLKPFEALYLDAGILHAYVRGAGLEIMANSDNVLRGGLTPKHIDIPQLCAILSFTGAAVQPVPTDTSVPGRVRYLSPASEFQLCLHEVSASPLRVPNSSAAPMIILCLEGNCGISDGERVISLEPGSSLFAAANSGPITITGTARVAIASCPAASPNSAS